MNSVRLLKSRQRNDLQIHDVFNEHEAHNRHRQIIDAAHAEAERILDTARCDADVLRKQVERKAHDTGLNNGLRAAEARIEELSTARATVIADSKIQSALPAIDQAAKQLRKQCEDLTASWEESAVQVCLALAEQLLHCQVSLKPDSVREMIAAPLRLAVGCDRIELRIHPDDCLVLGQRAEDFVSDLSGCNDIRLTKDATVERGGCIITTNHGQIDATIATQLERIAAELISDSYGTT